MTSIVVESGTGTDPTANSYVSAADLTAYATARGITLASDPSQLLIEAMDWIESLKYQGIKQTKIQPLQFPRYKVWVDGYPLTANTIPQQIKNGQMEAAIAVDQTTDALQDIPRKTIEEKVGSIEVRYAPNSSSNVYSIKARNAIWKLLENGSANGMRVNKA